MNLRKPRYTAASQEFAGTVYSVQYTGTPRGCRGLRGLVFRSQEPGGNLKSRKRCDMQDHAKA